LAFIIRIYHDARPSECQSPDESYKDTHLHCVYVRHTTYCKMTKVMTKSVPRPMCGCCNCQCHSRPLQQLAFKEVRMPKLRMWAYLSALVLNMVILSNLISLVTQ